MAYKLVDRDDHHRVLMVVEDDTTDLPDAAELTGTCSSTDYGNSNIFQVFSTFSAACEYLEEPLPEPHVNGDLQYLYVRRYNETPVGRRTNNRLPLRLPCWRKGRWKSLT